MYGKRVARSPVNESIKTVLLRLKTGSPGEFLFRAKRAYAGLRVRQGLRNGAPPVHRPVLKPENWRVLQFPVIFTNADRETVESILGGKLFALNFDQDELRSFEKSNRQKPFWQVEADSRRIDIRALWEPARLQHATLFATLHPMGLSGPASDRASDFALQTVLKWIDDNPFPYGPHYMSAMECGLRIPVFFLALKRIGDPASGDAAKILDAIYQHAWWISKRLSLYSSLGNHTICECVGLVFAGAVYRDADPGRRWLRTGLDLLENEIDHQVLSDGGPAEQSLNYHRFVLDLYWLATDFLEKNKIHDCSRLKQRLRLGERFLAAFQDLEGKLPSIGDSDDGYATAPTACPKREVELFEFGALETFPESGYSILRGDHGVLLTFDHGPLGMPPLFNHGHADALAVTLSISGCSVLVDPCAFRYNGAAQFRRYFKGTEAHNTVSIDGLDQAVQETGFIWSHPYSAKLLGVVKGSDFISLSAAHDGYARLGEPVWHQRSVFLIKKNVFVIRDTFSGRGRHVFALNFHIHPEAKPFRDGTRWRIRVGKFEVFVEVSGGGSFQHVHGCMDPILGWYSPSYGIRVPCGVLRRTAAGTPEQVLFETLIYIRELISLEA